MALRYSLAFSLSRMNQRNNRSVLTSSPALQYTSAYLLRILLLLPRKPMTSTRGFSPSTSFDPIRSSTSAPVPVFCWHFQGPILLDLPLPAAGLIVRLEIHGEAAAWPFAAAACCRGIPAFRHPAAAQYLCLSGNRGAKHARGAQLGIDGATNEQDAAPRRRTMQRMPHLPRRRKKLEEEEECGQNRCPFNGSIFMTGKVI